MRSLLIASAASLTLFAVACGGDDAVSPGTPGSDSGTDVTVQPDAQPQPDGGRDAAPDADAGARKFSEYVRELVETQTSDTRTPDTRVEDPFVEDEDPNAYPPSFFP
jgi:hypothetical protein